MSSQTLKSTYISSLYKSRNILLEQLEERGFDVSNYTGFSIHEIHIMNQNNQLDMLLEDNDGKKIYVKYNLGGSISQNIMNDTIEQLFHLEGILNNETDELLFIAKDEPNDTMIKLLNHIWYSEKILVNVYNIKRLQYNILKHAFVPKHTILTKEETEKFIETYNIQDPITQIPEISRFDPVAIAIGLRPNQICKIIRPSVTSLETEFYRICIVGK